MIGAFARVLKCPTPMFDATVPVYKRAMRTGHGEHDTAAVCAVLEAIAGVKRRKRQRKRRKGRVRKGALFARRAHALRCARWRGHGARERPRLCPPYGVRKKSSTAVSANTASGMLWRRERACSAAVWLACR